MMKNYLKKVGSMLLGFLLIVACVMLPLVIIFGLWFDEHKAAASITAILFVLLVPAIMDFTYRIVERYDKWAKLEL